MELVDYSHSWNKFHIRQEIELSGLFLHSRNRVPYWSRDWAFGTIYNLFTWYGTWLTKCNFHIHARDWASGQFRFTKCKVPYQARDGSENFCLWNQRALANILYEAEGRMADLQEDVFLQLISLSTCGCRAWCWSIPPH